MKRLFQVRDLSTGHIVSNGGFSSKPAAKTFRDGLDPERQPDDPRRYVVTPGPDHWNYEGGHEDHGNAERE